MRKQVPLGRKRKSATSKDVGLFVETWALKVRGGSPEV
jgi:hypothetical protein